jgi:hypothetical protein
MGFLDWMKRGVMARQASPERGSIPRYGPNEMAFRFQKPFAHLEHLMSLAERKTVEGIEARWKAKYEVLKNYPPMSEGQEHELAVFKAVDDVNKALDAREHAPFGEWKQREAQVDRAIVDVQKAFGEQRRFVEREVAEMKSYEERMAPEYAAPDSQLTPNAETKKRLPGRQRLKGHDIPF